MSRVRDSVAVQPPRLARPVPCSQDRLGGREAARRQQAPWATRGPRSARSASISAASTRPPPTRRGRPRDHTINNNGEELASQASSGPSCTSKVDALQGSAAGWCPPEAVARLASNLARRPSSVSPSIRCWLKSASPGRAGEHHHPSRNLTQPRARFATNASNRAQAAGSVGVAPRTGHRHVCPLRGDGCRQPAFSNGIAPGTWRSARWQR